MGCINLKTIKASYKSYVTALQRITERGFTDLTKHGSGYSHYLGEDYDSYNNIIEEADECSVSIESLFEYGRPKHIEKSYWIYKSGFVKFRFWAQESFEIFYLNHDHEKGKTDIRGNDQKLKIHFGSFGVGIGFWNDKKKSELHVMAKKCKPNVAEKILKAIENADIELSKWKSERQKLLALEI